MTAAGRRLRLGAVVVVLGLLLLGSLRGGDHEFPFGPFRMYATSGRPNGAVRTAALEGMVDGRIVNIQPEVLGLRRSELEGQYPRFLADPRLLGALAREYGERGVELDRLQLVERVAASVIAVGSGPTETNVLATWERGR